MDKKFLTPPKLTMAVVTGKVKNLSFLIDDIFPLLKANNRIRWIVGPKKNGQSQIINYKGYNPNVKPQGNNKGRPAFVDKKPKHMNSLRTCISFYVRSLNPNLKEDHFYIIKLYKTGSVNITGITRIEFMPTVFDSYAMDTFDYFEKYLNRMLKDDYKLTIEKDRFDNLNFKSDLLDGKKFNKKEIFNTLGKTVNKYKGTDAKSLKEFISDYIVRGEADYSILLNSKSIRIRYCEEKLKEAIESINAERLSSLAYLSSPFLSNLLMSKTIDYVFYRIHEKLIKAKENFLYMVIPPARSKGGVSLRFNIEEDEEKDRKINIYNSSYNTYVKNYDEALIMHNTIEEYIRCYEKDFIITDEVKFELVL